ncbi:hypothetical protein LMG28138_01809 [Pararobbsia alpina]|uniref:Uncharacterized protein n=1 Tax=Pararobbsia alpina TaxID=621374 RepID=A0A6S7C9N1_9BURK|nr:hypothetical protein LMG28138_01809 [Pararobbsia alpina]
MNQDPTHWHTASARANALHAEIERTAEKPERRCMDCGSAPDTRGSFVCECARRVESHE